MKHKHAYGQVLSCLSRHVASAAHIYTRIHTIVLEIKVADLKKKAAHAELKTAKVTPLVLYVSKLDGCNTGSGWYQNMLHHT